MEQNTRRNNPNDGELADSVAAIRAAWADFQAGDAGRPARQGLREACARLGVVIDETGASTHFARPDKLA